MSNWSGKGSWQRPRSTSDKQFNSNWNAIFGSKEKKNDTHTISPRPSSNEADVQQTDK